MSRETTVYVPLSSASRMGDTLGSGGDQGTGRAMPFSREKAAQYCLQEFLRADCLKLPSFQCWFSFLFNSVLA